MFRPPVPSELMLVTNGPEAEQANNSNPTMAMTAYFMTKPKLSSIVLTSSAYQFHSFVIILIAE